ncbi:hypothetical protein I317_06790 [Kwoniella heveanensis CBS 569]|nr:hypothetical protein I317_06790 [Kwoniella heveanensis CBS 569]
MGLNSPLPVRLEDETRKAAKILRSFVDSNNNGLDKVIPRHILERAAGFAIFTVFKAGFVLSARAGSGIVIARLPDGTWSPPSAIGLGGFGFGGQMGAEVTDFLIVLNSRAAVTSFMSAGSLTLGGNLSVAVGPLGRNAEGSGSLNTKGRLAAMYSYSKTKGLFGGVSVEGSVIVERQDANRIAYGGNPSAKQILSGTFDPPEWCHVLIDQLDKSTGLPGGQRWRDRDEDGEGGGMGWENSTPERKGGGYVFGKGVGAEGNIPSVSGGRRRAGSLFGGADRGGGKEGADRMDRAGTGSPGRPGNSRKGSSFNPFHNSGASSPRKNTLENSSENYTAGLTWDTAGPMGLGVGNVPVSGYSSGSGTGSGGGGRSRSGSLLKNGEVPAPFSYMSPNGKSSADRQTSSAPPLKQRDKDLLGDWDSQSHTSSSTTQDPFSSLGRSSIAPSLDNKQEVGGDHHDSGNDRDLLGMWASDGKGLSASFARLSTQSNGNTGTGSASRSRSDSRPTPFDDILEYPSSSSTLKNEIRSAGPTTSSANDNHNSEEPDYTPRETTSAFAGMNWSNFPSSTSSTTISSSAMGRKASPTKSGSSAGLMNNGKKARPFSSYIPRTNSSNSGSPSWSPNPSYNGGIGAGDGAGGKEFSPFEDMPVGRLRSSSGSRKPFEDYMHLAQPSSTTTYQQDERMSSANVPKPDLRLRTGLEHGTANGAFEGYARAVALFDFKAAAPGDLELKAGQVIIVLDKVGEKGEWWKGILAEDPHGGGGRGGGGMFPSSYVEVVELPKKPKGGLSWGELRRRVAQNEFD